MDSNGYFYFAIDAYSKYSLQIGMDINDNPETVL